MRFDEKILELSRTIYETSVIVHTSKMNKNENIDKIKNNRETDPADDNQKCHNYKQRIIKTICRLKEIIG